VPRFGGGWYDHVIPWNCDATGCKGYPGGSGKWYVYGFRIPLLVISAYMKQAGYISGACVSPGNCPNRKAPWVHDFGSILNFIEYAFGQNGNSLGGPCGIGDCAFPYADYLAPDSKHGGCPSCTYSLSDFFDFTQNAQAFQPITTAYGEEYFENYGTHQGEQPEDPDDDVIDQN